MNKKQSGGKQNRGPWRLPSANPLDGKSNASKNATKSTVGSGNASKVKSAVSAVGEKASKSLSESLFELTNPMPKASMLPSSLHVFFSCDSLSSSAIFLIYFFFSLCFLLWLLWLILTPSGGHRGAAVGCSRHVWHCQRHRTHLPRR